METTITTGEKLSMMLGMFGFGGLFALQINNTMNGDMSNLFWLPAIIGVMGSLFYYVTDLMKEAKQ